MNYNRTGMWRSFLYTSFMAVALALPSMAAAEGPLTTVLQDFDTDSGGAVPVSATNSHAPADSGSVISHEIEASSGWIKITDPDGGSNGAVIVIPGGIPAPGYYLFTADVKVDNASAPIHSYGMGVRVNGSETAKISDIHAGYVMNLTGSGDAELGYQTIGAAVDIADSGTFPKDVKIYFSTDVSGNNYNAPSTDGDFTGAHRSGVATWPAGSSNAVYVDNIKRHGPGNMGEERHLWISVGDGFTNLDALEDILVKAKANNFSAVDVLARYRADAYYIPNRTDATYPNPEPFGTRIGTVDASAENDPLQYTIDRCRELGLKVYISFSAFLVSPNNTYPSTLPADSVMGILAFGETEPRDMVASEGEGLWADLGRQDVRDYTKNILMDIVSNYDIDGVIFDRVRYPGSRYGYNEQALQDLGFNTTPSPFSSAFRTARRDVITDFLQDCYEEITTKKPWVVVGATPIAFGNSMTDTYNNVFQHWPTWTSRKTVNRNVSFGVIDLLQPQFYRLTTSAAPYTAPEANNVLMKKAQFGDVAVDSMDFGLMPGAYNMVAPLFYHPASGDLAQSQANAQNFTDARALANSGFGLFAATKSLADMHLIRDPAASTAGTDVLAGTPTQVDYLFKSGYDNVKPNPVTAFNATPQARGSVVFEWEDPAPAADGETASKYVIYKSETQPVREVWANQVTKLPVSGNWFHAPVGEAGSYYYKIVPIDDYNNRGEGLEIGPYSVGGTISSPEDVIIDNTEATVVGPWSTGTGNGRWGINYRFRSAGTGSNYVQFPVTVPVSGNWTVSEWHVQGSNRAPDAPHLIQHDGGTDTVDINQVTAGSRWNEIGTYSFTAGNSYSVTINDAFTNLGATVVMADAIKFSYVPTPAAVPAQPTGLTAHVVSDSQVNLTWNDNASNESGYELERTICGGTTVIIPLPAGTSSYSDTSLAADTEYKYVVRAWGTGTQSPDSNIVAARTLPAPPDDIIIDDRQAQYFGPWIAGSSSAGYNGTYTYTFKGDGTRTATFTFVPERTAVYQVFEWHIAGDNRALDAPHTVNHAGGSDLVIVNQQLNGSQWNNIGSYLFEAGISYSVVIRSNFTLGSALQADGIRVVYNSEPPTTPATPSNLQASAISDTEIGLTWNDNAINETGFEIVRTGPNGTETIAAPGEDSISYIDTGLQPITEYSYYVRAVNSQGSSGNSNIVTVVTLSNTPPDQIIDNTDADLVGPWSSGSFSQDKWASNYFFRGKSATGANYATFPFEAQKTGLYEIFEWHPAGGNRPTDAPHIVQHSGGTDTVLVNQQINGGQWNSIGTFGFVEGGDYFVRISDKFLVEDVIMADGIKVVYVGELPEVVAPTALSANPHGGSQVDLTWTDNSEIEQAIEIVRNGTVLTTVGPDVTGYSDTAAVECTPYTYVVRAVAYGIRSSDSNAATVKLDATNPVVTAPVDVVVNSDAGQAFATGVSLGSPVVSDTCDSSPNVTNNAPQAFALGETVVTWTAKDANGNIGTATQKVTVLDNESPVLSAPADVTVVATADDCFATEVVLGLPVVSDNSGNIASLSNDAPVSYPVGSTMVTWTAVDAAGNAGIATQTVVVEDNPAEAPATVSAVAQSWDQVAISWSDVTNETLYEVRYSTSLAGPYTVAGSTTADVTGLVVNGLLPDTTYYFVVQARNACGEADGQVAQATTPLYSGGASNPDVDDTWESVDGGGAEGGSYAIRARRSTDQAAIWSLDLPVSATYRVSVFIPNVNKLSTQANYEIVNGTTSEIVVVNQRDNAGNWVILGEYAFVPGPVNISVFQPNNSQNPVVVDALKIEQLN